MKFWHVTFVVAEETEDRILYNLFIYLFIFIIIFFCIQKCKYSGDRNFCGFMHKGHANHDQWV